MALMDAEMADVLDVVLSDLMRTTEVSPEVRDAEWSGIEGQVGAMLWLPDAGGAGIWIMKGSDRTHQVANVADQAQDWVVEALWRAGRSPVWPECPEHPNTHPLRPVEMNRAAQWVCPVSLKAVATIGSLGQRPSP
jgi:hypothetical protein